MFHRSIATRKGGQKLLADVLEDHRAIANDPQRLFLYAAKTSAITGRPIPISEARNALLKLIDDYESAKGMSALYVNDIDRATKSLSAHLVDLKWSILRSNEAGDFCISDTPVISRATDETGRVTFGEGIGKPTAEWILPISHQAAIRIAHRSRTNCYVNAEELGQLNIGQIYTMSRRLYGRSHLQWVNQMVQSYSGIYKFHVHVFKGTGSVTGDEFDRIMAYPSISDK